MTKQFGQDNYHVAPDGTLASVQAAGTQYDEYVGRQYGLSNIASRSPVVTLYFLDRASQNDELPFEKAGPSRSAVQIVWPVHAVVPLVLFVY